MAKAHKREKLIKKYLAGKTKYFKNLSKKQAASPTQTANKQPTSPTQEDLRYMSPIQSKPVLHVLLSCVKGTGGRKRAAINQQTTHYHKTLFCSVKGATSKQLSECSGKDMKTITTRTKEVYLRCGRCHPSILRINSRERIFLDGGCCSMQICVQRACAEVMQMVHTAEQLTL
jgi:hypothetical protein